ncbi:unannotated protein [freshwater metagenome]|uniref:Unannotated protein n=1 Tax=freshwater metagenome TaxID=449393 RepID=A0A6J7U8H8_9ZZZZ
MLPEYPALTADTSMTGSPILRVDSGFADLTITDATCVALMHAADCRPPTETIFGNSTRHASSTSSHRGAKEHPTGRLPGDCARPARPMIAFLPAMSGAAATKCRVYGWAGFLKISATSPCSTTRPEYITATSSAKSAITAKSCVMYKAATP